METEFPITDFKINELYYNLDEELNTWYGLISFADLEKIHGVNLLGLGETETEDLLCELKDIWDGFPMDSKVSYYNEINNF